MKNKIFIFILLIFSGLSPLFLVEAFLRVKQHKYKWVNFLEQDWNLMSAGYPVVHDPMIGWKTKSDTRIEKDNYQKTVTLLESGIRSNGTNTIVKANSKKILVVGASHAFGSEVSDDETWPAFLEKSMKVPVVNAAVFGYGIDQMVLRFESLVEEIKPTDAVLAFHPENISSCEMSQKFAKKPYFKIENEKLVLKNIPVPETRRELAPLQSTLGYSLVAHTIGNKLFPGFWMDSRGMRREHENGEEVACRLLEKFVTDCHEKKIRPVILVHQWKDINEDVAKSARRVIDCVKTKVSVNVLNLESSFKATREKDPKYYDSLFQYHMTREGNKYVASEIEKVF